MKKLFHFATFAALTFAAVVPSVAACPYTFDTSSIVDGKQALAKPISDNFNYILTCPNFTGNVGIGIISPQANFNVNGTSRIDATAVSYGEGFGINCPTDMSGGGYCGISLFNAARGAAFSGSNVRWSEFYNYTPEGGTAGGGLAFIQNNTNTRMIINSSGNVGIGTTTPGSRLDVNGTITMGGAAVLTSDRRLKTDIKPIASGALTRIIALSPVTFRWKTPKDDGMRGIQMGLIAQDVERILPTAVLTAHDAFKTKSVKYNELTAVLIKAVQEQQAQIAAMRADNATMRADNAELQSRISKLEAQRVARAQ